MHRRTRCRSSAMSTNSKTSSLVPISGAAFCSRAVAAFSNRPGPPPAGARSLVTQAAALPRAGSKREAERHTSSRTSCATYLPIGPDPAAPCAPPRTPVPRAGRRPPRRPVGVVTACHLGQQPRQVVAMPSEWPRPWGCWPSDGVFMSGIRGRVAAGLVPQSQLRRFLLLFAPRRPPVPVGDRRRHGPRRLPVPRRGITARAPELRLRHQSSGHPAPITQT